MPTVLLVHAHIALSTDIYTHMLTRILTHTHTHKERERERQRERERERARERELNNK